MPISPTTPPNPVSGNRTKAGSPGHGRFFGNHINEPGRPQSLPLNVYRNHDSYAWRHPITGQKYSLGNNRQEAFAQAHEANIAVLKLLEIPRLVHRIAGQPATLADWIESYMGIVGKRLTDGEIAQSTLKSIADFLATYGEKVRMTQAQRSLLLDIFRQAIAAGWCDKNPVEVTRSKRIETKR